MNTNSEKSKRVSLYFNENDQRAMYVYDLLQKQGRKKTKFIIDLILSNIDFSIVDKIDFSIVDKPKTKIQIIENKSNAELSFAPCYNAAENNVSKVDVGNDCSDNNNNSNDDFLSLIMSGLDAFN